MRNVLTLTHEGTMGPVFFASGDEWRAWLAEYHVATELLLGFHKKASGKGGITYAEALDEALAFGWIDGVRKSLGAESYTIRFSPRRAGSVWSAVNIQRVEELTALGRMAPPGLAAFAVRDEAKSRQYSYEQRARGLDPAYEAQVEANAAAWAFWQAQPPGYRRNASWWVMSAKREETRQRRLATLIEDSAAGRRIAAVLSPDRK